MITSYTLVFHQNSHSFVIIGSLNLRNFSLWLKSPKKGAKSTIFLTVFGQLFDVDFNFFYNNISFDSGQNSIRNADIANCLKFDL